MGALLAASVMLGACADFERGERAGSKRDVTAADGSGPGDIAGGDAAADTGVADVAGDEGSLDAGPDDAAELPPEVVAGEFSFAADIHGLLVKRCGECHTTGAPRALLLTDDPATDYPGVLKLVKQASPASSKLLLKGTAEDQHGGGAVLSAGTTDYEAILGWIAEGAFP